jgi:hypothetical protein
VTANAENVSGGDRVIVLQWDDGDLDTATERYATVDQIASAVLSHIEFNSTILAAAVQDASATNTLSNTTEVIVVNDTDAQRITAPHFVEAMYGFDSPVLPGTTYARNLGEELLDGVNIWRFADSASNGDNVTNDSAMWQRAADWSRDNGGRPVYIPPATTRWRLGTALTGLEGARLIGLGDPEVYFAATSTVMNISGPRMVMRDLRFFSSNSSTNFAIYVADGADDYEFENLYLENGNSFIRTFGDNGRLSRIRGAQLFGTLIRLDGTAYNNSIYDFGGPNIQTGVNVDSAADLGVGTGPHGNFIRRGKKWVVEADLTPYQQTRTGNVLFPTKHVYDEDGNEITTYGGDVFSCTLEGYDNTFEDNETIGSRDGSGTINGNHNIVRGHRASYGLGGGIGMFGSFNQIFGLETKYVRRGIVMMCAFGGFGSYNSVHGGHIRNSRYYGLVSSQVGIRKWVENGVYSSVARYCAVEDLTNNIWNIYNSHTGTSTFGPRRMTHTSGDGTDESIDPYGDQTVWTWVSTGTSLKPVGNTFHGLRLDTNGTEPEVSSDLVGRAHWRNLNQAECYRYGCPGFSDGLIPDSTLPQQGALLGSVPVYRRITGDTTNNVTSVLTTDGKSPTVDNQYVVGNTLRGRVDGVLTIVDNDSQGFRDWTTSASFRRTSSTAAPEFRVGSSIATPTFTQGNGTGLSWLDGITPVWTTDNTTKAIQISITVPPNASPVRGVSAKFVPKNNVMLELPDDDTSDGDEQTPPEET